MSHPCLFIQLSNGKTWAAPKRIRPVAASGRLRRPVSVTEVLRPAEYESRLQRYLFERSEEWRAVRVGEKEVSEQAEIVRRFADLFSREQLDALREAEDGASGSSAR